jgi:hypothetical protein
MAIAHELPIGYYVYTITVDGVVRYIGKGKGLRVYCHMKEVRSRLNRDYRLQNIGSRLQQNLTKAVLSGAKVIERVLVDNLTETAAYKLEYDKLREYVFAGKRDQLWNVIPASIDDIARKNDVRQRKLCDRQDWESPAYSYLAEFKTSGKPFTRHRTIVVDPRDRRQLRKVGCIRHHFCKRHSARKLREENLIHSTVQSGVD